MPVRARALAAVSAAAALLAGSGAASFPVPAGAAVRSVSYLPKQAVAVGTGGAVASDDVEATSAGLDRTYVILVSVAALWAGRMPGWRVLAAVVLLATSV